MADMDAYDGEPRTYEGNYTSTRDFMTNYFRDNDRDYGRERSRSPVGDRDTDSRMRDEPMNGRDSRDSRGPPPRNGGDGGGGDDDESINPGSNLFVTGIHPRLTEDEVARLFDKFGVVEKCNIMRDPHSRESRGFGFVKMTTGEEADAAKDGLQGEVYEGRTLSIEKARRAKPRTPTPGKYFGPPKRDDRPPRGGGYRDRYDDRGGYGGRRDDYRRGGGGGGGYRDRYDDRGYGGGRRGDDHPRIDRYASRDDRYGGERRGGGYGYDRPSRGPPADAGAGGYGAPRDAPPPRDYDDRRRNYD